MGKLHYVNRKIEGDKLGQVIAKDVVKRIPPASGHKAALRDPCTDLDITGKALNDEVFGKVVQALVSAYSNNFRDSTIIRLEELCAKGNELTATSLEGLATLVWLAAKDLRDLDLSENNISIVTQGEARGWEMFLSAIGSCPYLRRVDLSGNALGPKGFEIFARVYARNDPDACSYTPAVSLLQGSLFSPASSLEQSASRLSLDSSGRSPSGESSLSTIVNVGSQQSCSIAGSVLQMPSTTPSTSKTPKTPGEIRSGGLKHIPYIILDNTSMTCTSAMYLSYALASHDLPHRLREKVPAPKAGLQTQQLDVYDEDRRCRGIMYRDNNSIGSAGKDVLQFAEKARSRSINVIDDESSDEAETAHFNIPVAGARKGSDRSLGSFGRRRTLSTAGLAFDSPGLKVKSLDTARSRIQGNTIQEVGAHSNDLWRSALKMLPLARSVLCGTRAPPNDHQHQRKVSESFLSTPLGTASPLAITRRARAPSTPLAAASPNAPILRLQKHRLVSATSSLYEGKPHKALPTRPLALTPTALKLNKPYRSTMTFGLDENIWACILSMAIAAGDATGATEKNEELKRRDDRNANDYLSRRQQVKVVRWAADRNSLHREMDTLGKTPAGQVWNVLHWMDCLTYEPAERKD